MSQPATRPAFEVDKRGLEKILARRGKEFAVLELVQNALDEKVTRVDVSIRRRDRLHVEIIVQDDNPEGFADLSHAYTLFAESSKKVDPEKRGRFNLGEKLVLACCREASISTTKGTIHWSGTERTHTRTRLPAGSIFRGVLRMTDAEMLKSIQAALGVIVPEGIRFEVNAEAPPPRRHVGDFRVALPTEIADAEGYLRPTRRQTTVNAYETRPGEEATLFEMGIPVVAIDFPFHLDVAQKVPLNSDRDNVTPGYLRKIRTEGLNALHRLVPQEAARGAWAADSLESEDITPAAAEAVLTARYGDRRVVRDPSDPEATKIAVSKGYAVVEPGAFNRVQWETIRRTKAALPAGKVTPSPKPYTEGGEPLSPIEPNEAQARYAGVARRVARATIGEVPPITFVSKFGWPFAATYGRGTGLVLNVARLGKEFFENPTGERQIDLLIHEFGHHYSADHLSADYHRALTRIGARLVLAVAKDRDFLTGGR